MIKKGGDGTPLPDNSGPTDFINDYKSLGLTIDTRLQKATFKALSKHVVKWNAKKGFAIVMNVNNGEILSLKTFRFSNARIVSLLGISSFFLGVIILFVVNF